MKDKILDFYQSKTNIIWRMDDLDKLLKLKIKREKELKYIKLDAFVCNLT